MKSKVIAFFLCIKKAWLFLVLTLFYTVIFLLVQFLGNPSPNITNLLIGILSGLIASYLVALCEIYRININAKIRIDNIINIFCDYIINSNSCVNDLYKLYIDLLSTVPDLTYKSNVILISTNFASIIEDMRNNKSVQKPLKELQKLSIEFYK